MVSANNTDIVKVNPRGDADVMAMHNKAVQLCEHASLVRITDKPDLEIATNDLGIIASLRKAIEDSRKRYIKPLQDHVKSINEAFKDISEPINEADKIMRRAVLGYQQEQDRIRAEQAEINRLKQEAAEKEMALTGKVDEPVEMVEVNAETEKRVATDAGVVGQRMVRKWRLVDFALLPDIYKLPDSAKITKLVKGGGAIAGIEVYDEPILTVTATPMQRDEPDQREALPF